MRADETLPFCGPWERERAHTFLWLLHGHTEHLCIYLFMLLDEALIQSDLHTSITSDSQLAVGLSTSLKSTTVAARSRFPGCFACWPGSLTAKLPLP